MQMSMYAVSPLISVSDIIFYFEMRRKKVEEKSNKNILVSRFTKRSEKKVVFLSVVQSVCLSIFGANLGFFPQRNERF
jgi:hypothetical protein|tara:strand:- start:337 stop:570 length:234 start_codon:yes stop_codon:yes gene_type:complete